jgi:hypothetical protein
MKVDIEYLLMVQYHLSLLTDSEHKMDNFFPKHQLIFLNKARVVLVGPRLRTGQFIGELVVALGILLLILFELRHGNNKKGRL